MNRGGSAELGCEAKGVAGRLVTRRNTASRPRPRTASAARRAGRLRRAKTRTAADIRSRKLPFTILSCSHEMEDFVIIREDIPLAAPAQIPCFRKGMLQIGR